MRYFGVEDVAFTNVMNKKVLIKDLLPIAERSNTSHSVHVQQGDKLDTLAQEAYGDCTRAYDIFIENVEEIVDADFDLSTFHSLRIP